MQKRLDIDIEANQPKDSIQNCLQMHIRPQSFCHMNADIFASL